MECEGNCDRKVTFFGIQLFLVLAKLNSPISVTLSLISILLTPDASRNLIDNASILNLRLSSPLDVCL